MDSHPEPSHSEMHPYRRLFVSLALSYVVMFAVMYARVNAPDHILLSLNQAYMAGLMVAPMLIIMLLTMGSMYKNRRLNQILLATGVALTLLFFTLVRTQSGVGDEQFLNSMIPHHSAAILVCEEAALSDPRVEELCVEIIEAQEREIREMKSLLQDYD